MPKVSVSELEELTNEDDFIPPAALKRKLRKEKKENRPKQGIRPIDEE
jgi:hypothetical protein